MRNLNLTLAVNGRATPPHNPNEISIIHQQLLPKHIESNESESFDQLHVTVATAYYTSAVTMDTTTDH